MALVACNHGAICLVQSICSSCSWCIQERMEEYWWDRNRSKSDVSNSNPADLTSGPTASAFQAGHSCLPSALLHPRSFKDATPLTTGPPRYDVTSTPVTSVRSKMVLGTSASIHQAGSCRRITLSLSAPSGRIAIEEFSIWWVILCFYQVSCQLFFLIKRVSFILHLVGANCFLFYSLQWPLLSHGGAATGILE